MLMTYSTNDLASHSDATLQERKRALQDGLASAKAHGVEAPQDLIAELAAIQNELAKLDA